MSTRAFITGISGTVLTAAEREFIRGMRPWGFILFKRNIDAPDQVSALVDELRNCLGEADAPVLIDQEGGRVQRLGPPHWRRYPPGAAYAAAEDPEAGHAFSEGRLVAGWKLEDGGALGGVP